MPTTGFKDVSWLQTQALLCLREPQIQIPQFIPRQKFVSALRRRHGTSAMEKFQRFIRETASGRLETRPMTALLLGQCRLCGD